MNHFTRLCISWQYNLVSIVACACWHLVLKLLQHQTRTRPGPDWLSSGDQCKEANVMQRSLLVTSSSLCPKMVGNRLQFWLHWLHWLHWLRCVNWFELESELLLKTEQFMEPSLKAMLQEFRPFSDKQIDWLPFGWERISNHSKLVKAHVECESKSCSVVVIKLPRIEHDIDMSGRAGKVGEQSARCLFATLSNRRFKRFKRLVYLLLRMFSEIHSVDSTVKSLFSWFFCVIFHPTKL